MAALLRKLRSDLRSNRLQRVSLIVLIAFAVAALSASLTIQLRGGTAWEQLFRESNGAHAWFYGSTEELQDVASRPEVRGATDTYPVTIVTVPGARPQGQPDPSPGQPRRDFPLWLQGIGTKEPAIGRPVVIDGRWLERDGEIVLPRHFAEDFGYAPGDSIRVLTDAGETTLRVAGIAVFAGRSPYNLPVLAWTTPTTLSGSLEPTFSALGVQFESRGQSRAFRETLDFQPGPPSGVFFFTEDWNSVRQQNDEATEVIATFLGIFSLFALVSAAFVIVNAISGRVLARYRDIGLMKAMGFTPRQVAGGLLIEQLGAAVIAVVLGLLLGRLLMPLLDDEASAQFATDSLGYFRPGLALAIGAGVLALVTVATLVPAWRASRIPAVQAIVLGPGRVATRPSRLGELASRLRLPVWAVVGAKDTFDRPVRTWFTVAALVLSVVTVTFVATTEWTIRQLMERPELIGEPFELAVESDDPAALDRIEAGIKADPEVEAWFQRGTLAITPEGKEDEVNLVALGPGFEQVDWVVSQGRLFSAPGEATVGYGFLKLMDADVGDTVSLAVLGKPLELKIVGVYRATEDGGRWAMTSTETVRLLDPTLRLDGFAIALKEDSKSQEAEDRYRALGANSIEEFDHSADGINAVRGVLGGLGLMLLAVGLVSLVNTISLGVRERRRDLGILKAVGLTPRQVVASVVSGAALMALIAIVIGIPLGLWVSDRISDFMGRNMGWGSGLLEVAPATWIAGVAVVVFAAVGAAALIPAALAGRVRPGEALRSE